MLHLLASKSHWKHLILPAVLLCFQETCLQAEPSWCQCKTIHNKRDWKKKKPKPNLNHFTLKAYLCSTIHRFRVNIWDPWQACSVQSTYLSCSIWAWMWWSGRHPTWHHDKVNSIVCSTQGRSSLSLCVSLCLSPLCALTVGAVVTLMPPWTQTMTSREHTTICSKCESKWKTGSVHVFVPLRDGCFPVLLINFWRTSHSSSFVFFIIIIR